MPLRVLPNEGYSRNASCPLNLISTFLFNKLKLQIHLIPVKH